MLLPVLQHAQDGRQWSVRSAESGPVVPAPGACLQSMRGASGAWEPALGKTQPSSLEPKID